jgi:hypothetical protein
MNQWVQFNYINNKSLPLINSNYSKLTIIYGVQLKSMVTCWLRHLSKLYVNKTCLRKLYLALPVAAARVGRRLKPYFSVSSTSGCRSCGKKVKTLFFCSCFFLIRAEIFSL